jgi:hypothetical protein
LADPTRFDVVDRLLDFLAGDLLLRFAVEAPARRAAFFVVPGFDRPDDRLAGADFLPLEDRLAGFFAIPTSFPLKWLASYCQRRHWGRKLPLSTYFSGHGSILTGRLSPTAPRTVE